jgi:small subunit ribosomal protein S20
MAQHKSAKTRIRRNARRTEINKSRVSRLRSFVRKVEQAISAGSAAEATAAFREATPELHRAIGKGILHRNTVQRKLSRLSARIKTLEVTAK